MSRQEHRTSSQVSSRLSASNGQLRADEPDPEVVAPGQRRRFTAAYKQRLLAEAEECIQRGDLGALLRREGLYSSHLTRWREQRRAGQLEPQKRGRKVNSFYSPSEMILLLLTALPYWYFDPDEALLKYGCDHLHNLFLQELFPIVLSVLTELTGYLHKGLNPFQHVLVIPVHHGFIEHDHVKLSGMDDDVP